jgi:hypothetical protein
MNTKKGKRGLLCEITLVQKMEEKLYLFFHFLIAYHLTQLFITPHCS